MSINQLKRPKMWTFLTILFHILLWYYIRQSSGASGVRDFNGKFFFSNPLERLYFQSSDVYRGNPRHFSVAELYKIQIHIHRFSAQFSVEGIDNIWWNIPKSEPTNQARLSFMSTNRAQICNTLLCQSAKYFSADYSFVFCRTLCLTRKRQYI